MNPGCAEVETVDLVATALAGQDHFVSAALKGTPKACLCQPKPIIGGDVDQGDPRIQGGVKGRGTFSLGDPSVDIAQRRTAKTEHGNFQPGVSKGAFFHFSHSWFKQKTGTNNIRLAEWVREGLAFL
jgi:hypothetical protein